MASDSANVIFDANDKELTHEEIWDDTLLIQQYDEAMAQVQRQLHKRMSQNNTTESEQSEAPQSERIIRTVPQQYPKKKKKKKNKKRTEWHTGDPCRARYSEDNFIYEATIIGMNTKQGTCVVRYVGYNNEEEVPLNKLQKSRGVSVRKQQEEDADVDNSEASSSVAESDIQTDTDCERSSKRQKPRHRQYSHSDMMPPPKLPTSGPSFVPPPHLPHLPPPPALAMDLHSNPSTSEALHTMLMSWYMAGYHTGYYQGLKQSNSHREHMC
ncbi:survival motor neuron protein isoform X1 [Penaeus vannamei]|uniref:survival motor neuron protein isoform X1 n=1 Tax=Penaeus vannamei TaxID=6689 RepID=UPI00387F8145